MRYMKRRGLKLFAMAALLPMISSAVVAQNIKPETASAATTAATDPTGQQVIERVRNFLANVPRNDPRVFEDFFADDVIYTRSAGVTVSKPEIIKNIDVRKANEPQAKYDADDFTVHSYGDTAVVNFRLIMHNVIDGKAQTLYFRNTGTFLKRNGKWQAVAWQATRVPLVETKP
ncbi:MAG TPA: nuclear transport factor 2 family protein [Candidatus Angelobacter sp.]|nr:nuclear transport factor 2 family protein [Candidatus Angelobacter sp.]